VDAAGLEALIKLFGVLDKKKTRLLLASVNPVIRRKLEAAEGPRIPSRFLFPTLHDAMLAAQQMGQCPGVCIHTSASLNGCRDLITLSAAHSQHSHLNETTSHAGVIFSTMHHCRAGRK